MEIYHYSETTGEYLGQTQAKTDPKGDGYLIPANAVTVAPMAGTINKKPVWAGQDWSLVDDYRGWTGFDAEGNEKAISELGQKPDPSWTTEKPVLPEPVPTVVTMRQARLALDANGHLTQVENALSGMSKAAQIEWEYASTVERGSALTQVMIDTLGLTAQQTDDLFIQAAGL